ncbi:glycoside hydrolase superfamily [Paraphysoderma sedebokerense]|nr:glycoside hydrolase superfamily [Paraphysoderma sedebokerense]
MNTWIKLLLFAVLVTVNAAPQTATPSPRPTGFIGRSGTKFIKDGCPFYFHGTNSYYLPYSSSELINSTLDSAKSNNLTVIRTWAFLDYERNNLQFQSYDKETDSVVVNHDNKNGLGALDRLVAAAKSRDIKLILVLTNNWEQYGGMDVYNDWFKGNFHDDFYDTASRQFEAYKNYTSALLNRVNHITGLAYKDEPTIFAWELANEPRCKSDDGDKKPRKPKEYKPSTECNAQTITKWIDAASTHIKSIDSNHLVAIGDEGFGLNASSEYNDGFTEAPWPLQNKEGLDAETNLGLPNIDFGTFHLYAKEWIGSSSSNHTQIQTFTVNYINYQASLAKKWDKPVILEEYGSSESGSERLDLYYSIQDAIIKNTDIAGSMFWVFTAKTGVIDGDDRKVYASEISLLMGDHIKAMEDRNAQSTT